MSHGYVAVYDQNNHKSYYQQMNALFIVFNSAKFVNLQQAHALQRATFFSFSFIIDFVEALEFKILDGGENVNQTIGLNENISFIYMELLKVFLHTNISDRDNRSTRNDAEAKPALM